MKAHIRCSGASILLTPVYSDLMGQIEAATDSMAWVEVPLLACYTVTARTTWIKMLKAQVDAGRYLVDSRAIAKKVQVSPAMRALLEYEIDGT